MPDVRAELNYLPIAPRKVRLVADTMRGRKVTTVRSHLEFLNKGASLPLLKLLRSAEANAKHNFGLDGAELFIREIRVDEGPTLKRLMPRAFGRAYRIRKRSSHITLVLAEKPQKQN